MPVVEETDSEDVESFPYASEFDQHLLDFQAHLAGDGVAEDAQDLQPSYIAPTGFWTPLEKKVFFHALSVHSRLRPDLIAACVGTKTLVDVCTYIDALDETLSQRQVGPLQPSDLNAAIEVSDAWVRREEQLAGELVSLEKGWEEEQNQNSSQEDLLSHLEYQHLRVMEGILLKEERFTTSEDQHFSTARDRADHSTVIESHTPQGPQPPYTPHRYPSSAHTPTSISPSPPVPAPPVLASGHSNLDAESTADLSNLSPPSRRRFTKRLYMRRKRAALRGEEATAIPTKLRLRPGRRPKVGVGVEIEKKQTRKPLNPRGVNNHSDSENLNAGGPESYQPDIGLCSGQERSSPTASGEKRLESVDCGEEAMAVTCEENKKCSHPSGMTRVYKIQNEFESKKVTVETLMEKNLGFFHLSTLGRLINLFQSGYSGPDSVTATSISADTIRFLTVIVVDFVTEVAQRSVILRERQNSMKSGTKVHRSPPDEISQDNIYHALEMMGIKDRSKQSYFSRLLGEDLEDEIGGYDSEESFRGDILESEDEVDNERADNDSNPRGGEEEHAVNPPILLPLHREINPPFVHLPKSLTRGVKLPTSSVIDMDMDTEEELMPEDTDEEALEEELEAEMIMEEAERERTSIYEAHLWERFGNGKDRKRRH